VEFVDSGFFFTKRNFIRAVFGLNLRQLEDIQNLKAIDAHGLKDTEPGRGGQEIPVVDDEAGSHWAFCLVPPYCTILLAVAGGFVCIP
jgi:hypothetical protein